MDSKRSIHFKNDAIVCVVRIIRENAQNASSDTAQREPQMKGLLVQSMAKFRQDLIAVFFPLI